MSENLTLAERLKKQKAQESATTQNLMKQQLNDMRSELNATLKKELNTFKKGIQKQQKSMSWAIIKSRILWPFLMGLSLCAGLFFGSWGVMEFMTYDMIQKHQEISEMRAEIESLRRLGGKIKTRSCNGRICVKLDSSNKANYGTNGEEWRVMEGS